MKPSIKSTNDTHTIFFGFFQWHKFCPLFKFLIKKLHSIQPTGESDFAVCRLCGVHPSTESNSIIPSNKYLFWSEVHFSDPFNYLHVQLHSPAIQPRPRVINLYGTVLANQNWANVNLIMWHFGPIRIEPMSIWLHGILDQWEMSLAGQL